ncbi:MAG: ABC transporter ATP-binding protein [Burkholderiaceae bacterium]
MAATEIAAPTVVLEARQLSKRFGGLRAVESVDFSITRHGVTSIIGPNGAGKSTFFNLVNGALMPDSGHVLLEGEDITRLSPSKRLAKGMARSFQITNLFSDLTVLDNLRLACQFLEPKVSLLLPLEKSRVADTRCEELLREFTLFAYASVRAGALSHGHQRRLEISMAMATRPSLLLLDEPTQGMSHADTHETAQLIAALGTHTTILLIEHDVDLVMSLSKKIMVMSQGEKLAEGTPDEIKGNPAVQAAYFGGVV